MKIKLQRPTTGQEIVDAFKSAGTYQFSAREKWEGHRRKKFVGADRICEAPVEKKVTAWADASIKRLFFGEFIWCIFYGWRETFRAGLPYLNPNEKYEAVNIVVSLPDQGWTHIGIEFQDDNEILKNKRFKRLIDDLIMRFCDELQPKTA